MQPLCNLALLEIYNFIQPSGGLICLLVYTASAWHLVYFLPSKWMHAPMGPRDPNLPFYVSTTNFCLDLPPQLQQAALTSTRACWALPLPGNLSCMHKGARPSQVQFKLRKASGEQRAASIWEQVLSLCRVLFIRGRFGSARASQFDLHYRLSLEAPKAWCFFLFALGESFLPLWIASRFPLLHWN